MGEEGQNIWEFKSFRVVLQVDLYNVDKHNLRHQIQYIRHIECIFLAPQPASLRQQLFVFFTYLLIIMESQNLERRGLHDIHLRWWVHLNDFELIITQNNINKCFIGGNYIKKRIKSFILLYENRRQLVYVPTPDHHRPLHHPHHRILYQPQVVLQMNRFQLLHQVATQRPHHLEEIQIRMQISHQKLLLSLCTLSLITI